jgi:hypothetical protein
MQTNNATAASVPRRSYGPEVARLAGRLVGPGSMKVKAFHVDWVPGSTASPEERAAEVNMVLDQLEAGDFEDITDVED